MGPRDKRISNPNRGPKKDGSIVVSNGKLLNLEPALFLVMLVFAIFYTLSDIFHRAQPVGVGYLWSVSIECVECVSQKI